VGVPGKGIGLKGRRAVRRACAAKRDPPKNTDASVGKFVNLGRGATKAEREKGPITDNDEVETRGRSVPIQNDKRAL